MGIGGTELLIILVAMLVVLGPERTTLYARKIGKWLRILKVYLSSLTEELRETVVEPLQEMQEPLKEITKPFEDLTKELNDSVDDISKPFEDVSKDVNKSFRDLEHAMKDTPEKKTPEHDASQEAPRKDLADTLEMAEFVEDAE